MPYVEQASKLDKVLRNTFAFPLPFLVLYSIETLDRTHAIAFPRDSREITLPAMYVIGSRLALCRVSCCDDVEAEAREFVCASLRCQLAIGL